MKNIYLPIAIVVLGGIIYHLSQKSIPKEANPLYALIIAYLTGILICLFFSFIFPSDKTFLISLKESNWAVFGVGLGAALIEMGILFAYRAGWQISMTALLTNVLITLILIPVGLIFFREHLSWLHSLGIALCLCGLYLMSLK